MKDKTYLMMNRVVNRYPLTCEYVVFSSGKVLRRFTARPLVANRYCHVYDVEPASPADYYREVVKHPSPDYLE